MKSHNTFIIIIGISMFTAHGCADFHSYDSNKPNDYREHWENNSEIKDNDIYVYSEECKEDNKTDFIK